MKTKIMAIAVAVGLALMGSGASAAEVKTLRNAPVSDGDIQTEMYKIQDGVKLEKSYRGQPPLVPHETEKYEIDLKVNKCLQCHEFPNAEKEKAPEISKDHYKDRDGNEQSSVNGNRYFCIQCHVPQANATPLIPNTFQGSAPAPSKR